MRVSSLLGNDTDAANDTLRITAVSDAVNGRAFLDGTTVTYKHDGSETITGSFTYSRLSIGFPPYPGAEDVRAANRLAASLRLE